MIQLRWLAYKHTKTLQYRVYTPPPEMIGPKYPPGLYGWSEWKVVPEVEAEDENEDV